MRYVLADKAAATAAGFREEYHLKDRESMMLSEKEMMMNDNMQGTFEERVQAISGRTLSEDEAFKAKREREMSYE